MHRARRAVIGTAIGVGFAVAGTRLAVADDADKAFVREAASAGRMEVELGRHASRRAADSQVRRFGERMASDHAMANAELARVAEVESITPPSELRDTDQARVQRLMALRGAEFDRAYMRAMVQYHEEDVAKFREASRSAASPQVKAFAAKTLPTLQQHLKIAKEIASRLEKHASAAGVRTN